MMDDIYTLKSPQKTRSCAVFSSPHSGSQYPAELLKSTKLDSIAIRSSEDAFVDELYSDAPKYGAHLLTAHLPRAYIDLNRSPTELDPAIVRGAKRQSGNPRIAAGLGIIPRVVGEDQVIRTGKISLAEAKDRIAKYYLPYHACLKQLLDNQRERHGMAILFDCHSMPRRALTNAPLIHRARPDIVLGNRYGASSDRWVLEAAAKIFEHAGFVVALNSPFSGGYITQHYGRPSRNFHALQIEINRSIYMDEKRVCRGNNFNAIRSVLSGVTKELSCIGPVRSDLAAE